MQYGFRDFGQTAVNNPSSIRIVLNDNNLDEYLTNSNFSFRTLSVNGRGKTNYNVDTQDVYGMHGTLLNNSTLNNRTIVVRALVIASSNEEYRRGMERLLYQGYARKVHQLRFTDDIDHVFFASCQRIEDDDETSNRQIVELEFVCTDPYKYTDVKTAIVNNANRVVLDTSFQVVPDEIEITFERASDARSFSMNNIRNGYRIVYDQIGTASGTTIRIRQRDDYIGYLDSVNNLSGLNVRQSHFDEFTVHNGDQIVVTPTPAQIKITYRGARL